MKRFAKRFIRLFKRNVDKLYRQGLIGGRKDVEILGDHEHTFLINVAIYLTVKEIDKSSKNNQYSIIPEYGGRSPTDFMILKNDNENQLCIEHENSENRILTNYKKLVKNKNTKERLLICYIWDSTKISISDKIKEIKTYKKRHKIFKKPVHILIANKGDKNYFYNSKDYRYYLIN